MQEPVANGKVQAMPQPPQFADVADEVEAVVDHAVAVVVEAVAGLDAAVGLHALAAVAGHLGAVRSLFAS